MFTPRPVSFNEQLLYADGTEARVLRSPFCQTAMIRLGVSTLVRFKVAAIDQQNFGVCPSY